MAKENIFSNANWSTYYKQQLKVHGEQLLFECSLTDKDCKHLRFSSSFLKDVVTSWTKLNNPNTEQVVHKQIIWNNSKIKNRGNVLFFNEWYERGIKFVEHIFDFRSKMFYTFEHLKWLYNIPSGDYLKYYTLIHSIPPEWKYKLKTEDVVYGAPSFLINKIYNNKLKLNKIAYIKLIRQKSIETPKYKTKWNVTNDEQWNIIHTQPFNLTIDTKLREFQYKYILNIVPNNSFLYKCHLTQSNLCDFCNMYIDSTIHMFWECHHVQTFWTDTRTFLQSKFLKPIVYTSISYIHSIIYHFAM